MRTTIKFIESILIFNWVKLAGLYSSVKMVFKQVFIFVFCGLWIYGESNVISARRKPFRCLKPFSCIDVNNNTFRCSEENVECCRKNNATLAVEEYPRGKECCEGAGIFDVQTHKCVNGALLNRKNVLPCGSNSFYNQDTQTCCTLHGGNHSMQYLTEGLKMCCGIKYVHSDYEGCCNGTSYDKNIFCCKNKSLILPIRECHGLSNTKSQNYSNIFGETNCTKRVCSSLVMEKRFDLHRHMAAYMFTFQVGRIKGETSSHQIYKVKYGKQLLGKKGKIKTVEKNLKIVGLPKCGCPKNLRIGTDYVVITKTKVYFKKLFLHGNKYFILSVNSTDVFAKVFHL
uniref:uncharacterized protein LOC120336657 n=1 Tax=Styela clava TaxID=7725 RepID=UPI00193A3D4A|nr:uncharacterized protein LOC120336657 [Styela clava]